MKKQKRNVHNVRYALLHTFKTLSTEILNYSEHWSYVIFVRLV